MTPDLAELIADGTLPTGTKAVPTNRMDLYKGKMKMFARVEEKFERDCTSVYLLVKGQCSPNMISELNGFYEFDVIEEDFHLIDLLKLIKKICYNYKTQEDSSHS